MAAFSDVIAGLEKAFNIQAARNMTDNAVGLGLEDGSVVNVEHFPEGEALHVHYDLGGVPPDIRPVVLMSLMAVHTCGIVTQGCHFGFEPQRESLLLFRSLPMRGAPAGTLVEMIGHFMGQALHWRAALPGLFEEAGRRAGGGGDGQASNPGNRDGTMIKG